MIKLNTYIIEAWSGVKKQTSIDLEAIKAWCDEMRIGIYAINPKGEIDVKGNVNLGKMNFKELPYKFGTVTGSFDISSNKNLTSLKNCPDFVSKNFYCDQCPQLDSLIGCPKEVGRDFYCFDCKRLFTEKEIKSLCKIKVDIIN